MLRGTWREAAAELLGTFVLIVFGIGVVAEVVLSRRDLGTPLIIHLAWGLAVTMGIYVSAGVSGAHLNPAVTLALAALRGFPWRKVPAFVLAQMAGAFAGAAVAFSPTAKPSTTSTAGSAR
jgi:glycerol uptake facilitator-like aquaporin